MRYIRFGLILLGWLWPVAAMGQAAQQQFDELFARQVAEADGTRRNDDNVELAQTLVVAADKAAHQADLLVLICQEAYRQGMTHPTGYATAVAAMQRLLHAVPERAAEWHEMLVDAHLQLYNHEQGQAKIQAADELLNAIDEAVSTWIADSDYERPTRWLSRARQVAQQTDSTSVEGYTKRLQHLQVLRQIAMRVQAALRRVSENPRDLETGQRLVQLYLVSMNDPIRAREHASYSDAETQMIIELACRDAGTLSAAECLQLGDWYYDQVRDAELVTQLPLWRRADDYYHRYLSHDPSEAASRTRAEIRAIEIAKAIEELTEQGFGKISRTPWPDGLIVHLTFDRATVFDREKQRWFGDQSGIDHHAQLNGVRLAKGRRNQAVAFEDDGAHVSIDFAVAPWPHNQFSYGAWIRTVLPHEIDAERGEQYGGLRGQRFAFTPGGTVAQKRGQAVSRLSVGTNGLSVYETAFHHRMAAAVAETKIGTRWNHVFVVYQDGKITIYRNGKPLHRDVPMTKGVVWAPHMLGGYAHRGHSNYFHGLMDDVMIFNRALTAAQVNRVYSTLK